ncbi:hypothetical protein JEZ13_09500 [bacterium]|nr:hypothetical protein [bacterium]
MEIMITNIMNEDINDLSQLLLEFRLELADLKQRRLNYNLSDAKEELSELFSPDYEVYKAMESDIIMGYAILRKFDQTVWLEQIFVKKMPAEMAMLAHF